MDKTRVDDMLIEMISPKVEEIEKKFSKGEGLTQEDINTLLLKSQYNHINHLDTKLNEVTDTVKELKGDFNTFKAEVKADFETSQKEIQETINKAIVWLISGGGVMLFLFKALDLFVK